ncbi:MAG: LysR family transcriptional regulator, partial [Lachnospiraceae bacterium]|nr:LysR family transcriptional regulator [Lachnospiraceae bacterium]
MEIRQLITFIRVVQFQSFSKAAESLGYSQSAVTIQIKNLEQDLNTHLFDRIGKRVSLTPQGEKFLTYAYNIINEMNHAKVALDDKKELTGSLKIGTVESLCFTKFPQILKK